MKRYFIVALFLFPHFAPQLFAQEKKMVIKTEKIKNEKNIPGEVVKNSLYKEEKQEKPPKVLDDQIIIKDINKKDEEPSSINASYYMVSLGVGYESFYYFSNEKHDNNASENYLRMLASFSYYFTEMFATTWNVGILFAPTFFNSGIKEENITNFPTDVSRFGFSVGGQLEVNWSSFKDSLQYVLLGIEYVHLTQLKTKNSQSEVTFPNSPKNLVYAKIGFGDRLTIFPNVFSDVVVYLLIPFKKQSSFTGDGNLKLQNLTVGVDVSFGYFN